MRVLLVLLVAGIMSLGAPALAQTPPTPVPSSSPADTGGGLLGSITAPLTRLPAEIANAVVNRFTEENRAAAQRNIQKAMDIAYKAVVTPDFTSDGQFVALWWWALGLVNGTGLIALLMMVWGFGSMFSRWTHLQAKVVIPRAAVALFLADASLLLMALSVKVGNFLSHLFTQVQPSGLSKMAVLQAGNMPFLLVGLISVVGVLLVVTSVIRYVGLVLLGCGAPFFQIPVIYPRTEIVTRIWWRAMTALLLIPAVQMFFLTVMVEVVASTGEGAFGKGAWQAGALVLVLLLGLVAIPVWLLTKALRPAMATVAGGKKVRNFVAGAAAGVATTAAAAGVVAEYGVLAAKTTGI